MKQKPVSGLLTFVCHKTKTFICNIYIEISVFQCFVFIFYSFVVKKKKQDKKNKKV